MRKRGFTLIELLVVIAIIGILATVVLVNLQSGRARAKASNALQAMRSVQSVVTVCLDTDPDGSSVTAPADPTNGVGVKVCGGTETWPDLSGLSWAWGASGFTDGDGTFSFAAADSDASTDWAITCTETGCTKTGF